jgi:hypothetical protein
MGGLWLTILLMTCRPMHATGPVGAQKVLGHSGDLWLELLMVMALQVGSSRRSNIDW